MTACTGDKCHKCHPPSIQGWDKFRELVHKYCLTQVWCACLWLAARLMSSRRSGDPGVLCLQTQRGRRACDDEAWSVWYWPVDVTLWLVGDISALRCTSILEARYSLSIGSFLSSFPILLPPAFSYPLLHSFLHLSFAFLSSPLPYQFFSLSSFHLFYFPLSLFLPSTLMDQTLYLA